ncbi:MAG: hypothetical protein ACRBF0_07970 [Calditrichia bacterium]
MDRERTPAAEDAYKMLRNSIDQSKKIQESLEILHSDDEDLDEELEHIEEHTGSLIKTLGQTLLSAKRFEEAMLRFGRITRDEE